MKSGVPHINVTMNETTIETFIFKGDSKGRKQSNCHKSCCSTSYHLGARWSKTGDQNQKPLAFVKGNVSSCTHQYGLPPYACVMVNDYRQTNLLVLISYLISFLGMNWLGSTD